MFNANFCEEAIEKLKIDKRTFENYVKELASRTYLIDIITKKHSECFQKDSLLYNSFLVICENINKYNENKNYSRTNLLKKEEVDLLKTFLKYESDEVIRDLLEIMRSLYNDDYILYCPFIFKFLHELEKINFDHSEYGFLVLDIKERLEKLKPIKSNFNYLELLYQLILCYYMYSSFINFEQIYRQFCVFSKKFCINEYNDFC